MGGRCSQAGWGLWGWNPATVSTVQPKTAGSAPVPAPVGASLSAAGDVLVRTDQKGLSGDGLRLALGPPETWGPAQAGRSASGAAP